MAGGTKMYVTEVEKEVMPMMCGDLFDHIDDLLDFPNDNNDVDDLIRMEGGMVDPSFTFTNGGGVPFTPAAGIPPLQNEPSLILPPPLRADCDDGLIGGAEGGVMMTNTGPSDNTTRTLNGEDDKVFENLDIADLEWFSNFIYDEADSFSLLTLPAPADIKEESIFRTSSPVSVLEPNNSISGGGDGGSSASSGSSFSSSFSASSCSGENCGGGAPVPMSPPHPVSTGPGRARSKRPRTTTFSPRSHVSISFLPTNSALEPESFGESSTGINPSTVVKSAKKKKKKSSNEGEEEEAGPPAARRCTHCQIQKTPQWRAGPMGPKTLCNACGVRYKSGRLFPEYRPAASPTFVPSIHSNSHKKVVEMRLITTALPGAASPNNCDLLDYIRRRD